MGKAQFNLNEYKYVVIPKRFSDFKEVNEHRTSTLLKYLFTQKGFITVYDDNLPDELYQNRCLGLFADLADDSSMFTTKTAIVLNDCDGKEIMLSQEGKSKKKDFEDGYNEAISAAFKSFSKLSYSYEPKMQEKEEKPVTISFDNDVKTLDEKPENSVKQNPIIVQKASKEIQSYEDRSPIASDYKKAGQNSMNTSVQKASREEQSYIDKAPVATDYQKGESPEDTAVGTSITGVLYAQELPNGYQLVDSAPKIQLKIFKSSMPNVYLAKADDKDGLVYISDGKWFFEYYSEGNMIVEELNIKF